MILFYCLHLIIGGVKWRDFSKLYDQWSWPCSFDGLNFQTSKQTSNATYMKIIITRAMVSVRKCYGKRCCGLDNPLVLLLYFLQHFFLHSKPAVHCHWLRQCHMIHVNIATEISTCTKSTNHMKKKEKMKWNILIKTFFIQIWL